MDANLKIYIGGTGAITSVGKDAQMTFDSVNADINRYQNSAYLTPQQQVIKMALPPTDALPELSDALEFKGAYTLWDKRLLQLAHAAMQDAVKDYEIEDPIPLILACPQHYSGWPHQLPDTFKQCLIEQSGISINPDSSRTVQTGRTGILEALQIAFSYFLDTDAEAVLIGGVDSFQRPELLEGLIEEGRLAIDGVVDGFTPGEGAGFILLTRNKAKAMNNDGCMVSLRTPGLAQEVGHMYSDQPYLGEGLANAVKQALTSFNGAKIQRVYSTMNGERFWAKELGVALTRSQAFFSDTYRLEHPADCYGDLGAASGAVLITLAAQHLVRQKEKVAHLVCCSSDNAFRAAVVMSTEVANQVKQNSSQNTQQAGA
ncbi:MAG TPA: hypothetical protein ENJ08_05480 [Gammaproteobacteria bacterium]|nr:hypothetical protein [Gammaproteobacteria bacterium]